MTQGKSPVRECRTPGSVRGVLGNWHPYRDHEFHRGGKEVRQQQWS